MLGTAEERLQEFDRMYPKWEEDTLWSRFEKSAVRFKNQIFVVYQNCEYTYGQALEEVNRLARSCYACGIREDDHVAVLLYNSPEYIFLTFALSKIGAVKVPINMKLAEDEMAYVIRQSRCKFAISHTLKKIPQKAFGHLKAVIIRYQNETDDTFPPHTDWTQFLYKGNEIKDADVLAMIDPYRMSDILYTSGSTSFPKGVMLSQDMLLRSSFGTCRTRKMEVGRRILVPIPMYHIFGYNEGLLAVLWIGGCVILTDRKSEGTYILEMMKKTHANDVICVPIVIMHLLEAIGESTVSLPDLHAGYWASTCPDWVWDKAKEKLGITDVTTGYGMTECGSTTMMFSPGCSTSELLEYQGYLKEAGCAGEKMQNGKLLEIQIRNLVTGEILQTGFRGELYCRGLTVTKGYYRNPEANRQHFDEHGWFATGDVGYLDEQGRFSFQGRKDSMYKINGENVSPQQLNYVIGSCRLVKAVETVGIENSRYGEVGVAFIDLNCDTMTNRKQLAAYMQNHLADFQIPHYMITGSSEDWPRTSCGKIGYSDLKKKAAKLVKKYEQKDSELADIPKNAAKSCAGAGRKELIWI